MQEVRQMRECDINLELKRRNDRGMGEMLKTYIMGTDAELYIYREICTE